MLFRATDTQAKKIAQKALDVMGIPVKLKDINLDRVGPKAGIYIDTFGGKKVSLILKKVAGGIFYVPDKDPPKKAGWAGSFKSYKELIKSIEDGKAKIEFFPLVDSSASAEETAKIMETPVKDRKASKEEKLPKEEKPPKEVKLPGVEKVDPPKKENGKITKTQPKKATTK